MALRDEMTESVENRALRDRIRLAGAGWPKFVTLTLWSMLTAVPPGWGIGCGRRSPQRQRWPLRTGPHGGLWRPTDGSARSGNRSGQ